MPTFYHEVLPSGGLRQIIDWTPAEVGSLLRTLMDHHMPGLTVFAAQPPAGATNGIAPVGSSYSLTPQTTIEAPSGPKPASAPDTRYYPCTGGPGGPSCRDLGTHHDPETGVCLMPGCVCTQFTPWTPPVREPVGGEEANG